MQYTCSPQPGLSVVGVHCPKPRIVITGESLNLHQIPLLENNLSISHEIYCTVTPISWSAGKATVYISNSLEQFMKLLQRV